MEVGGGHSCDRRVSILSSEQQFLDAICADPEDENMRLVFADWCEEQGDPRAEFIRVQLALDKLPRTHPWREEMERTEQELKRKHLKQWNAPYYKRLNTSRLLKQYGRRRSSFRGWDYARGFIEHLRVEAEAWTKHWQFLKTLGPIRSLKLYQASGWLSTLASCSGTQGLVHLDLSYNQIGNDELGGFLEACPSGLQRLNVSGNHLSTIGAGHLLECTVVRELQILIVSNNDFSHEDLELLQSHFGERLQEENGWVVGQSKPRSKLTPDEMHIEYDDHVSYEDGRMYAEGRQKLADDNDLDRVDMWAEEPKLDDFYREEEWEPPIDRSDDWWQPPEDDRAD